MFGRWNAASFAGALVAVALTLAASARGAGPAEQAYAEAQGAERAYAEAQGAEQSLDFARALGAYRRAFELNPSGPLAGAARTRAEALEALSAGGFGPLRELEALRRDQARLGSIGALEAFARAADGFPPGPLRDEARLLAVETLVRRLGATEPGGALARALADDASAAPVARAQGALLAVEAVAASDGDASAARLAKGYESLVPGVRARYEHRLLWWRGRAAALASLATLGAAALVAALGLARGGGGWGAYGRARLPSVLVGALVAAGALLAGWLSPGVSPEPFLTLGAGVVVVDAAVALVRRRWARASWGRPLALGLGLAGVAAAAYLSLAWRDPLYLESLLGWS